MSDRIKNPSIDFLHSIASKLRSDFGRFYRDTEKERIRFNFTETNDVYTFKIKFTPSHRVLKFVVQKNEDIDCVECQLYEKTNNIIRDIDQIYKLVSQEYLYIQKDAVAAELRLLNLWYWGITISPDRKNDIYKVQADWYSDNNDREDVLFVGIINKITELDDKPNLLNNFINSLSNYSTVYEFSNVATVELELLTEFGIYKRVIQIHKNIVKNIYPKQIFISNWLDQFAIMRFTPAKHHINFTSSQGDFIARYLSETEEKRYA